MWAAHECYLPWMSERTESGTGRRMPSRGVVVKPLRAGEPFGQPFQDRAYITPRFPEGIKRNELRSQPAGVQRETILIWFLHNYERPRGPYFGFGGASQPTRQSLSFGGQPLSFDSQPLSYDGNVTLDGTAPFDGIKPGQQPIQVAGFGQAPFYDGGTADGFLAAEFAAWVRTEALNDVSEALPGQWVLKPDVRILGPGIGAEKLRSALGQLLDEFDAQFREVPTSHGQRWHNGPPERLPDEIPMLAPEERDRVLRATADMRLALASRDYSRAGALWDAVSPVLGKVGTYVLKQADAFVGTVNKTVAAGVGFAVLAGLAMAVGLLDRAAAVNAILKALHLS